jgi:Fic family protein
LTVVNRNDSGVIRTFSNAKFITYRYDVISKLTEEGRMKSGEAGRHVDIVWNGRRVRAFVPTLLAERDLTLSPVTVARTATAAAEVGHAAEGLKGDFEALARLLLRSEGVASSYVEGITAPIVDIVLAEENLAPSGTSAAWVATNLAAVTNAVATAATAALSVEALCQWHRTIMTGSPTPERYVGTIRNEQGWIGGNDPTDAHLVTPPPEELDALLDDLIHYITRDDTDPVAQAGIAHAQFEIIHPFADGNGRVGRVLVSWILTRRLSLITPPPVSVAIAADVSGYSSGLALYRLGQLDQWVQWFADAVRRGGQAQRQLVAAVATLKAIWPERLRSGDRVLRSDATAWAVLDLLPRHLVLTTDVLIGELGVTNKGALDALRQLTERNVLLSYGTVTRGRGQPSKLFVSRELLALAGSNPLR